MGLNQPLIKILYFAYMLLIKQISFEQVASMFLWRAYWDCDTNLSFRFDWAAKVFPDWHGISGKDSTSNVAIPHTDIVHNSYRMWSVRLDQPVNLHNMIDPDKEVQVSLLFFIINNSL